MDAPACLIVDDDLDVLIGLVGDLAHRYGGDYEFFAALDAAGGVGILERLRAVGRPVALVIAKLRLPDMAGPDLLSRARSLHPLAKRALLIDAGVPTDHLLRRAMTLGQADGWLTKPWAPADQLLHPTVSEMLGEWLEDSERPRFVLLRVVGWRRSRRSHELSDVLERNNVPYEFHPVDTTKGRELLRQAGGSEDRLPVVVLADGRVLVQPADAEVAAALGVRTRPQYDRYDLAVVGAGPAGLSAAVYAASEGVRTVLIEREAFGGQAGTTARIRNYLGFPRGISGRRLARRARRQAVLFGADLLVGDATGLRPEERDRVVELRDGVKVVAGAVVIATGVSYRRLGVPAVEELVGAGVFYGAAMMTEAPALQGEDVVVVGAGNSAGQAAVHLARFASRVLLVARGESLEESMSAYLIDELRSLENVTVRLRTRVVHAAGSGRLEQVALATAGSGASDTVRASALFILIGAEPRTDWLAGVLERDANGFVVTGRDVRRQGAADADRRPPREPFSYESSLPGVFAIGDVRASSSKRIAAAVGEGSVAVGMLHQYLRDPWPMRPGDRSQVTREQRSIQSTV
jgi:thioredoxin reductase (NADPH)